MAQYRATIRGARGSASRLGNRRSGIVATVNGWNVGVTVTATHENGEDVIRIVSNGGSNARSAPRHVATVRAGTPTQAPTLPDPPGDVCTSCGESLDRNLRCRRCYYEAAIDAADRARDAQKLGEE